MFTVIIPSSFLLSGVENKVQYEFGYKIRVSFDYVDEKKHGRATRCHIVDSETGVLLAQGISRCNKSDKFCKPTGRILALDRALLSWKAVDREIRKQVWQEYWKRVRPL